MTEILSATHTTVQSFHSYIEVVMTEILWILLIPVFPSIIYT